MVVLSECDHHRDHHQHDGGGGGGDAAVEGSTGSVIDSASNKAQRASTYAAGKEWCQKLGARATDQAVGVAIKKEEKMECSTAGLPVHLGFQVVR